MPGVMLAIGDFQFEVSKTEYQELEKSHAWRWPSFTRINQKSASQYQGPEATELSLSGIKYISAAQDIADFKKLKAQGDKGKPLRLISGSESVGRDWGLWVMLTLTEKDKHILPDGTPTKIEFSLRLKEYG